MKTRQIIAGLALLGISFSAAADERWFPGEAKRGIASFELYPKIIIIDGKKRAPSPVLRVWDKNNATEIAVSRKINKAVINYTEGKDKLIDRIWILTPREAAKPLKTPVR
jgi:hypothetical protein